MRWSCPIRTWHDVDLLRAEARRVAIALGHDRRASVEIAIVAVELATNVLKYGVEGRIEITDTGDAIEIEAWDRGPPFRDFALAQRDDHDDHGPIDPMTVARRGGFGGGLGAVVRLTASVSVSHHGPWKCVRAIRRRPPCTS